MAGKELRATRYLTAANDPLGRFIVEELPYLDYHETCRWYSEIVPLLDREGRALLGCNDRYFLLTGLCGRVDALHPWIFDRCREVEASPDGHLDLWARYHYKSSVGTFAGLIQEIMVDPEITICILSATRPLATAFLTQIQQEFESNDVLKDVYSDVLWTNPRTEAPRWSRDQGIEVRRRGNPKEATIEAWGLIDAQPTGKHYKLLDYDDVVTQDVVGNPEIMQKVTERWELSDNLGTHGKTRKWHFGTRYDFTDTYGVILARGILTERRYPATVDGTLRGEPVLLSPERWEEVKLAQRSTVAAQMLLNPIAGSEATFLSTWFKTYEVIPAVMNVYIMVDPSMGRTKRSDRTAIAVIGLDAAGNKYLLDGYRHRMRLSERYQHMKNLYLKWKDHPGVQMVRVGYERYGQQVDLEVIEEYQAKDGLHFAIEELAFPREGQHSKVDRIRRLQPDISAGRFYLPAVAWHPDFGGVNHRALWTVWTDEDAKKAESSATTKLHAVGDIIYRPMQGLTRTQRAMDVTMQKYRIVDAITRKDEDGNAYDLTRAFIEEAMFHPASSHDDLIDAVSRIYDMQPKPAVQFEDRAAEPVAYKDS